jgi:hypothetical protein
LVQGYTNTGRQVAMATEFFTVAPDYNEAPVCNLLRVTGALNFDVVLTFFEHLCTPVLVSVFFNICALLS